MRRTGLAIVLLGCVLAGALAASVLADGGPPGGTTSTATTSTTTTAAVPTIATGVMVGGTDVGGLSTTDAISALTTAFEAPLRLRFGHTVFLITPDLLGGSANVLRAARRAGLAPPGTVIPLEVRVDRARTARFVSQLAQRFDTRPVDSRLFLRNLKPHLTRAEPGRTIEVAQAVRAIAAALLANARGPIAIPATLTQPAVTASSFGPVLVIRRSSNRLFLYEGARLRREFQVATGQRAYPTPLGEFKIIVLWRNPWWYPPNEPWARGQQPVPPGPGNPLGTRWMGISYPGVGIHGTPDDASIGYSVSHGCIRMHIHDAEWLFDHVRVGAPVFIVAA